MGAEAVMALMESDETEPPCVVSLDGNQVCQCETVLNPIDSKCLIF